MLLVRIQLYNRPGALGAVATALGAIGADINLVEIVEKHPPYEVDELILTLPPGQLIDTIVDACDTLDGVQVQWIRNYPRGGGIELDVDLLRRMAADPVRSGEILVSAAPLVFRAHWSVLVDGADLPRLVFATSAAPDLTADDLERFRPFESTHRVTLEDGWLPGWPIHHAVVAPLPGSGAVVVGRRGEPAFFRSELARLNHLVGVDEDTDSAEAVLAAHPGTHHRTPVSAPLYTRDEGPETADQTYLSP